MSKKFCTCRPRLSSYDNSSACVAMWFKLRRLGVYKVKNMGMNLKNQGSGGNAIIFARELDFASDLALCIY